MFITVMDDGKEFHKFGPRCRIVNCFILVGHGCDL